MKAVVVKEVGVLEVQDVPEPQCKADEIKVKIAYAGICGTDSVILKGQITGPPPEGTISRPQKIGIVRDDVKMMGHGMREGLRIIGHEASGTIVEIGKDIKGDFRIGQHVAMNYKSVCGACHYCTNMMANFCERTASYSGAMAEFSAYRENIVFKLPDDLPLDVGAFLEPLSIAVHALDIARMKIGDSVLITGGGPIGLLMLQLAIKSGASIVLVSEPIAEKRQLAKQFGAQVVDPLKEDLLEISNKITDGRGFNVCLEASGIPAIARQLILLTDGDGTVVWVASYPRNLDLGIPINYFSGKELTIRGVRQTPYSFPRALQMLPTLDLKPLITIYPLRDAVAAFEAHKKGQGVKIMLKP